MANTPALLLVAGSLWGLVSALGASPESFPDLSARSNWNASEVPFSFRYGGRDSAQLLRGWKSSQEGEPDRDGSHFHRFVYADPVTQLKVIAEVRTFPDNPGAIDWVLRIRNDGAADSPVLEEILPLSWTVAMEGNAIIHHARGSNAQPSDFEPLEERLGPGGRVHLCSRNGRSSDTNTLPFFNLQSGSHGVLAAIGWTGNWKADFVADSGPRPQLTLSAGMQRTHLRLHPGEEIRTPRIVLLRWSGGDWLESQNLWRRLVLAHYCPQEAGRPMRGCLIYGAGDTISEQLALVKWIHDHHFPLDYFAVDAGWYGDRYAGTTPDTFWWMNRGNWYPNPRYCPDGMRPLGEALKRDGFGFSLWVEPETAMPGTRMVQEHPDWYLNSPHPVNPGVMLANLGRPDVRQGLTKMVSRFITDYEMTWYRQDFNIPPEEYWALADSPDRIGMTEIRHIEGLYRMWDDLLASHPGLHIDNCSSGGRRIDLEMMSRSYVVWRTDLGTHDTLAEQAQTQGLDLWDPLNSAFEAYTDSKPWLHPGPYATPSSLYLMRLGYNTGYCLTPGAPGLENPEWVDFARRAAGEFREVQPYFYGDFYPLAPASRAAEAWTLWQWDRPESHDGLVIVLRRPANPSPQITLALRHIAEQARYEVEIRTGYEKRPSKMMRGAELARLVLALPEAPSSILVFYRRL